VANTLNPLLPKLIARGLLALRQEARMARLVNRAYELTPGTKGSTVTIPVPTAVAVQDVAPANIPPATPDTEITDVQLPVDQWKEAAFYLTDKDIVEIDAQENYLPMQASEAIKALANTVDSAILALYKDVYGFAGTPGVTPFAADVSEYLAARKVLNDQLAPMDPRFAVIDTAAEANALGLRAFQDASFAGSIDGIVNGQIHNKLGARWSMNQNMPTHTTGAAGVALIDNVAGYAPGVNLIHLDGLTTEPSQGDVFTIAGHAQTYTVLSATDLVGTDTDVTFAPKLRAAVADNAAVTFKASHAVNLLFHPMAFAFVSRPFAGADPFQLGKFFSAGDPISGLTLRLEVTREHKRTRFAYDILYGARTVRAELAARMAG
jgi:hypothetical protein